MNDSETHVCVCVRTHTNKQFGHTKPQQQRLLTLKKNFFFFFISQDLLTTLVLLPFTPSGQTPESSLSLSHEMDKLVLLTATQVQPQTVLSLLYCHNWILEAIHFNAVNCLPLKSLPT